MSTLWFSPSPPLSSPQTCKDTLDIGALTKASDFVKAFVLGFQVEVSLAGVRVWLG